MLVDDILLSPQPHIGWHGQYDSISQFSVYDLKYADVIWNVLEHVKHCNGIITSAPGFAMGVDRSTLVKPVSLPTSQALHLVQCLQGEHPAGTLREDCARVRHQFPKFLVATAIQAGQAEPAVLSGVHETTSALLQGGHIARHNSFPSDHHSMRCRNRSLGTIDPDHESAMICT